MRYIAASLLLLFLAACGNEKKPGTATANNGLPVYVNNLQALAKKYPDSLPLQYQLVDAYDSLAMFTEGLAIMDHISRLDSNNNEVWIRKGVLQEKVKDTVGALQSYWKSIRIYPAPEAQLSLANLYAERKNDTALLLVSGVAQTIFDSRTLAECDFIAGVYHSRSGNMAKAEQFFNRSIEGDRKLMEAYIEKGLLYFDRKKFADALKIFEVAGTVEPTYADAFYYQGRCQELLGKQKEAIALYEQSLRLDPALKEAAAGLQRLGVNPS